MSAPSLLLAAFPGAATPSVVRSPGPPSANGDGAGWQRAFDAAAPGARESEAGRLLELNGEIPAAARPSAVVAASAPSQVSRAANVAPIPTVRPVQGVPQLDAGRAQPSPDAAGSPIGPRLAAEVAGRAAGITAGASTDGAPRSDKSPASGPLRDPVALSGGGSMRAIDAYAAAMVDAGPRDQAVSFTVVSRHNPQPVRVHVQWRGRVADVWIGLHRHALEQLPEVRDGVHSWVATRGGIVGRLVCNGETLESASLSHSLNFTGEL